MDDLNMQEAIEAPGHPRAAGAGGLPAAVAGLLVAAAALVSWLATYAFPDALAAAELIPPPPAEPAGRPQRMAALFVVLMVLFSLLGLMMNWSSRRQLRRLDALAEQD